MGVARLPWNHPIVVRRFLAFLKPCPCCDCILFTGALSPRGWGRFAAHDFPECPCGRTQAHRYSYAIFRAPIPPGHQLNHSHELCNHRNCVNPYHLGPLTIEEHARVSNAHKTALREHDGEAAEDFFD